ncbi:MAG: hypothetical protein K1V84_01170 [Muribaculaceae bacterium]
MAKASLPKRLIARWNSRRLFVIVDIRDNSVTLSRRLFRHMLKTSPMTDAKIFVFRVLETDCYGFTVNPDLGQETQLADLQYNTKHKCIGFETLNPTVAKILYGYGISGTTAPVKLSITIHHINTFTYYQIEKPRI